MVLVRAEALEVEDMAAGQNDLVLSLEVLEADRAHTVGVVTGF